MLGTTSSKNPSSHNGPGESLLMRHTHGMFGRRIRREGIPLQVEVQPDKRTDNAQCSPGPLQETPS